MTARASDLGIVAGASAGLLGVLTLLAFEFGQPKVRHERAAVIGSVAESDGPLRRRPVAEHFFEFVSAGDGVAGGDAVFTPPGTTASLELDGNGRLDLAPRTLLVLDGEDGSLEATLRRGALLGVTGRTPLVIRTIGGVLEVSAGSRVELAHTAGGHAIVSVERGAANLAGNGREVTLGALESASIDTTSISVRPRASVELLEPTPMARFYVSDESPQVSIRFAWTPKDEAVISIASDADFSAPQRLSSAASGDAVFVASVSDVYFWRVEDSEGTPLSLATMFTVRECESIDPISPSDSERVIAGDGSVTLHWVAGRQSNYEVELAADVAFESPIATVRVGDVQATIANLAEGNYWWRVRPLGHDGSGRCTFSSIASFELLRSELPAAPSRLKAKLR